MGTRKNGPNLGAVMTYVISPTRALLVKEMSFPNALWKLPGGGVEETDAGIIAAAIREVEEETGVELLTEEVVFLSKQRHENDVYYPYLCVASVSEEKLDTRLEIADEDGNPMETRILNRTEVLTTPGLLERHRSFVREVELG